MKAKDMAKSFSNYGWGTYNTVEIVQDFRPGDIMSSNQGHVYLVVGSCLDGSVVLLHSSAPGVQLCGTATPDGTTTSQAVSLAEKYMQEYFPKWYNKYPNCFRGSSYLTTYNQMRWDLSENSVLNDPDDISNMSAEQVLQLLFGT